VNNSVISNTQKPQIEKMILIESVQIGVYCLILLVTVVAQLFQKEFISISIFGPVYLLVTFGLAIHLAYLHFLVSIESVLWIKYLLFFFNATITSVLILVSGFGQTIFFFMYLVNILISGLVLHSKGSLFVALITAIEFTFVMIVKSEFKAAQFLFVLALNDLSFFSMGILAGYLSDQLDFMGKELVRAGKSMLSLKNFNEILVANIPSGIVTLDKDQKCVQANNQALRIFQTFEKIERFLKGIQISFEAECETKYENEIQVYNLKIAAKHFFIENQKATVVVVDDLTNQKKIEEQLRQQEKMAAIGGLAAGIAHEIRNPLAGISGSVEMLSQTATNSDDKKLFNIVLRETDRLNRLITEFLEYAKPPERPKDEVELSVLLKEVQDLVIKDKGIPSNFNLKLNIENKIKIKGFRDKLVQAFLNIIINSVQAMGETVNPEISVTLKEQSSRVFVSIKDNGCGMSEKVRQRIFEPFFTTKSKGTGLGLAMTHKIFENHSASVKVFSTEGVGTEFEIQFPSLGGRLAVDIGS
jgi:two-component system sensor histidine kinase PilS (NtrC family)